MTSLFSQLRTTTNLYFFAPIVNATNHYIDWSRALNLFSGNANKERAIIIGLTSLFSYVGYEANNRNNFVSSSLQFSIAAGFLGLVVSHAFTILPLIQKRLKLSKECTELIYEIERAIQADNDLTAVNKVKVHDTTKTILERSLSDGKGGRASQTWGWRHRVLTNFLDMLSKTPQTEKNNLLANDINILIDKLDRKEFSTRLSVTPK